MVDYEKFVEKKKKTKGPDYLKDDFEIGGSKIKESFTWMTPKWKVMKAGKNSVKIQGIALPGDIVSKNKMKYLSEEIKMAARTLSGKPITINHSPWNKHHPDYDASKVVGDVPNAEFESGAVEYWGFVRKEPYVTMLRTHDPRIKGVSIEASYIHNRCIECGERFYSEKAFKLHMSESHGIVDGISEPHGIHLDALSLVIEPETPGVPSATVQVMETESKATILRLYETHLAEKGLTFNSNGVAISSTEEPEKDEHGCLIHSEKWDGEKCVPKEVTENVDDEEPKEHPVCKDGFVLNPASKVCEPVSDVAAKVDEIFKVATETQRKKLYCDIIRAYNHTVKEHRKLVETDLAGKIDSFLNMLNVSNTRITALENSKVLKETVSANLVETVRKLTVRQDNLEAKQKGSFKGQSPAIKKDEESLDSKSPYAQ